MLPAVGLAGIGAEAAGAAEGLGAMAKEAAGVAGGIAGLDISVDKTTQRFMKFKVSVRDVTRDMQVAGRDVGSLTRDLKKLSDVTLSSMDRWVDLYEEVAQSPVVVDKLSRSIKGFGIVFSQEFGAKAPEHLRNFISVAERLPKVLDIATIIKDPRAFSKMLSDVYVVSGYRAAQELARVADQMKASLAGVSDPTLEAVTAARELDRIERDLVNTTIMLGQSFEKSFLQIAGGGMQTAKILGSIAGGLGKWNEAIGGMGTQFLLILGTLKLIERYKGSVLGQGQAEIQYIAGARQPGVSAVTVPQDLVGPTGRLGQVGRVADFAELQRAREAVSRGGVGGGGAQDAYRSLLISESRDLKLQSAITDLTKIRVQNQGLLSQGKITEVEYSQRELNLQKLIASVQSERLVNEKSIVKAARGLNVEMARVGGTAGQLGLGLRRAGTFIGGAAKTYGPEVLGIAMTGAMAYGGGREAGRMGVSPGIAALGGAGAGAAAGAAFGLPGVAIGAAAGGLVASLGSLKGAVDRVVEAHLRQVETLRALGVSAKEAREAMSGGGEYARTSRELEAAQAMLDIRTRERKTIEERVATMEVGGAPAGMSYLWYRRRAESPEEYVARTIEERRQAAITEAGAEELVETQRQKITGKVMGMTGSPGNIARRMAWLETTEREVELNENLVRAAEQRFQFVDQYWTDEKSGLLVIAHQIGLEKFNVALLEKEGELAKKKIDAGQELNQFEAKILSLYQSQLSQLQKHLEIRRDLARQRGIELASLRSEIEGEKERQALALGARPEDALVYVERQRNEARQIRDYYADRYRILKEEFALQGTSPARTKVSHPDLLKAEKEWRGSEANYLEKAKVLEIARSETVIERLGTARSVQQSLVDYSDQTGRNYEEGNKWLAKQVKNVEEQRDRHLLLAKNMRLDELERNRHTEQANRLELERLQLIREQTDRLNEQTRVIISRDRAISELNLRLAQMARGSFATQWRERDRLVRLAFSDYQRELQYLQQMRRERRDALKIASQEEVVAQRQNAWIEERLQQIMSYYDYLAGVREQERRSWDIAADRIEKYVGGTRDLSEILTQSVEKARQLYVTESERLGKLRGATELQVREQQNKVQEAYNQLLEAEFSLVDRVYSRQKSNIDTVSSALDAQKNILDTLHAPVTAKLELQKQEIQLTLESLRNLDDVMAKEREIAKTRGLQYEGSEQENKRLQERSGLISKYAEQIDYVRRTWMEGMQAQAINLPTGVYTLAPGGGAGGLSERQMLGSAWFPGKVGREGRGGGLGRYDELMSQLFGYGMTHRNPAETMVEAATRQEDVAQEFGRHVDKFGDIMAPIRDFLLRGLPTRGRTEVAGRTGRGEVKIPVVGKKKKAGLPLGVLTLDEDKINELFRTDPRSRDWILDVLR